MNAQAIVVPIVPQIELKRILYATDLSEASLAALPLVSTIARKYGSHVFVANIWAPIPYTMMTPEMAGTMDVTHEDEIKAQAGALLSSKELSGLPATLIVEPGGPVVELDRIVRQQKIDLAIIGTHGRTGFKHLLMGSVAEELFRSLPCPVLTVGPNVSKRSMESTDIKHILFPTDLSDESRAVFPYLASLAAQYKSMLTLLHVLPVETASNPEARRPCRTVTSGDEEDFLVPDRSSQPRRIRDRLRSYCRENSGSRQGHQRGPDRNGCTAGAGDHHPFSQHGGLSSGVGSTLPGADLALRIRGQPHR